MKFHKRIRIAYGEPKKVEAWSYLSTRTREIHVEIVTAQGEAIQIVVTVPR